MWFYSAANGRDQHQLTRYG